ncbi:MAG TPA: monofunctional biosynthetic peptidoglycan transglycosylase [Deltaproteobacteria bacterium]|nr:MAG: monofunctional biosynthetic peptidoglycan transglycosylase [Deltaproteobacteria bacterium GWA2_55_82]OGQ63874.1 MAG: monofunctional biosynthetic peptidoglycan transglycosylase [Deltaproteobacteria bacterium RIFCSPLOWO2_02_FULL_55_12]OIJ72663.1 MAG: monofunctional biosynthetic peptidoglycan transglycosylase [Deltaproteobacteria bacterium GWC2_55_46]HBG47569.1 monofunctional biosynthetic peptidoglycan transglycosylase [Deltaproteobacteria bacterium]HCY10480.1 monofunctional biosynthetic p
MKKAGYAVLAFISILVVLYLVFIPGVSNLKKENPKKTAMMEYREAEWAAKKKKRKIYQVWVPYSRISPYMTKAVILAEDDKFWSHEGFDFEAMQKAIEKDLKAGKLKAGGSTISQQLAKNLYLRPTKSPVRKVREAVITWKLERTLSKRRILELYLNVAEWGDGVFGVEAASRHHFGKSAAELTPMEAARLAVVLPNPRRLNASGTQGFVDRRANLIYSIMVRRGIVIQEFEEIEAEPAIEIPAQPEQAADQGQPVEPAPADPLEADAEPVPAPEPASQSFPNPGTDAVPQGN